MHIKEIENQQLYYWAYGMNTSSRQMTNMFDYCEPVGPATLNGYHLTFAQFANVEPGGSVQGVLWKINRDTLKQLDHREGWPTMYRRKLMPVTCNGQQYRAVVYYMTPDFLEDYRGESPSKNYIKTIASGYLEFGLPIDQIRKALVDSKVRVESFAEDASCGAVASGGIAPVAQPMGTLIKRNPKETEE